MPALKEIEKQAMHLERTERALLAAHLIASIDPGKINQVFRVVFDAIRQLMAEPPLKKRPIGFIQKDKG